MTTEGQNTPVSAHGLPSAGLEGQDATQETPDATEAAQRRVERQRRYEDTIAGAYRGGMEDDRLAARAVIAVVDEEIRQAKAEAWAEGYDVATDDFVHSDYCGRTCQCQGIHGRKNPYRDAPKDTTAP